MQRIQENCFLQYKMFKHGRSLLVPCVQELAKEKTHSIPTRYIRPHQPDLVISEVPRFSEIPVIHMQNLLSEESRVSELAKLHHACREWGFFQVLQHDVSSSLLEKVKMETQNFFNLPISEKKKFWQTPEDLEGFGQVFVVREDQKLNWGDLFLMTTQPIHFRKQHLFPNLPLPFRETLELYSLQLKNLAMIIIEHMGKALQMEASEMIDLFEDGIQTMRMNYYPPCPQPDQVIGLCPHSDPTGLTILLQINEVEGLQVRKNGMWIPVNPLPNSFIVNLGDVLEIVSNGIYVSPEHQAIVNSEKERLSIATFYSPRREHEIGPSPSLITEQNPAKFTRVEGKEYFTNMYKHELDAKSYLETMRLA